VRHFISDGHGDISAPNHEKYRLCEERSDVAIQEIWWHGLPRYTHNDDVISR
jgi:hypothetical protein